MVRDLRENAFFLDEVIWADVPTFLKIRDFVRDD